MRHIAGSWLSARLLWGLLCLLPACALAQSGLRTEGDVAGAKSVYDAEVPVASQADADRNGALARALGNVLARLSGDRSVAGKPGVAQELRNAAAYVGSYDYRQDQTAGPGGVPTFRTILVAHFKPEAVDSLASALGLPVWPQPRPKPVLWLAIDDGSGPRLVGLQQANAARPLLDRAVERGFRLGLPSGTAAEQAAVGAIWRQDVPAVARSSARYSPPMQLIGKLYRSNGGWAADWSFADGGNVLATWSSRDADPRRVMVAGADGAADALFKRYAKVQSAGPAGTYRVAFSGVDNAEDYMRLAGFLQGAIVVRRAVPVHAAGSRVEFDLDLLSGLPGFDRMLGSNGVIVPVEGMQAEYRLR